jgi:hypothetical protein
MSSVREKSDEAMGKSGPDARQRDIWFNPFITGCA